MIAHPHVTGAILAGGSARRMGGVDKALLPLTPDGAETPLSRSLAIFQGRFAATLLIADDPAPYRGWNLDVLPDLIPGCGPLGGLHAALNHARTPFVFACGCDMPSLSGALLDFMALHVRADTLLVPVRRGRPEPLHAIHPVSCLAAAERALRGGVRMMTDFFEMVEVDFLPGNAARLAGRLAVGDAA